MSGFFYFGIIALIAGFVAYQIGFSAVEQQSGLAAGLSKAILPFIADRDLARFALQMGGGLLAIAGLIITVAGATGRAVRRIPVVVSPPTPQREAEGTFVCKFCREEMPPEEVFCPQCHRSQL